MQQRFLVMKTSFATVAVAKEVDLSLTTERISLPLFYCIRTVFATACRRLRDEDFLCNRCCCKGTGIRLRDEDFLCNGVVAKEQGSLLPSFVD